MIVLKNKKVLIFSDWYYPGYKAGGPIKSLINLSLALQQQFDVYVFTADTDINEYVPYTSVEADTWVKPFTNSNVQVYYCSKSNLCSKSINTIISDVAPASVYLNHMWSFWFVLQPLFICWIKFKQIKIVLCPRGALFESAIHYLNTYLKKRILLTIIQILGIHKHLIFHATSVQEKLTIQNYFGMVNIKMANNLPDLHQPKFIPIPKIKGELKLTFIARIVEIKNLKLLLDNLLFVKSAIDVTIAGPIGDNKYWSSCLSVIEQMPGNITITYIGEITPNEILPLIQKNHLYCLPTQGENFGHSIFESFMTGRPVLISDQTPWLDLQNKNAGWDINLNVNKPLVPFIEQAANWDQEQFNLLCQGAWSIAYEYMNNPNLISDYNQIFN